MVGAGTKDLAIPSEDEMRRFVASISLNLRNHGGGFPGLYVFE
jgi:hypothetical protein